MRHTKTVRADELKDGDVITAIQYGHPAAPEWKELRIGQRVAHIKETEENGRPVLLAWRVLRGTAYTFSPDEQVEIKEKP